MLVLKNKKNGLYFAGYVGINRPAWVLKSKEALHFSDGTFGGGILKKLRWRLKCQCIYTVVVRLRKKHVSQNNV